MRKIALNEEFFDIERQIKGIFKLTRGAELFCELDRKKKFIRDLEKKADVKAVLARGNGVYLPFAGPLFKYGRKNRADCADGKPVFMSEGDPGNYGESDAGFSVFLRKGRYVFESLTRVPGPICELPPSFEKYFSKRLAPRMESFLKGFSGYELEKARRKWDKDIFWKKEKRLAREWLKVKYWLDKPGEASCWATSLILWNNPLLAAKLSVLWNKTPYWRRNFYLSSSWASDPYWRYKPEKAAIWARNRYWSSRPQEAAKWAASPRWASQPALAAKRSKAGKEPS